MPTIEDILMVKGPDVIVTASTSTVLEVSKMMAQANVGSIIVRDSGEVLGIFTERDLLRRIVARGKDPSSVPVCQVMSAPVKSCRLSDDVRDCTDTLTRSHIRHLAVVEEGTLVGLISLRDILTVELRASQEKINHLQAVAE